MKRNAYTDRPRWCPNAIATHLGWADPETGELLACNRHLENPVEGYVRGQPWTPPKNKKNKSKATAKATATGKPKRKAGRPTKAQQEKYQNALKQLPPLPKRKAGRPTKAQQEEYDRAVEERQKIVEGIDIYDITASGTH